MSGPVIYIAAKFPKLSETFVYREVQSLRKAGVDVPVVSVRPPEDEVDDPEVQALRHGVIPVYGSGALRLLSDISLECLCHPLRSLGGLGHAFNLIFFRSDLTGPGARAKVMVQALASLALARRLRPLHPVLLHAHMAHVPATFAMCTARQLGIPFSFTGHAADLFRDRALLIPKLTSAAFVHCISHWHQEFYQQRVPRPPLLIGGAAMWWGFVHSALKKNPRYDDLEFRRFLRQYQWQCLLKGKTQATRKLHEAAKGTST
jgi:colanic acid/amylovoran biosynthesis glycosyltransferase